MEDFVARITLVGFGWGVTTLTLTNDKPVSQKHCAVRTVQLFHLLLYKESVLVAFQENLLDNLCMYWGTGPAKMVIRDVEPLIDLFMYVMIVSAYLLWGFFLYFSLYLCRRTVLVRPADE